LNLFTSVHCMFSHFITPKRLQLLQCKKKSTWNTTVGRDCVVCPKCNSILSTQGCSIRLHCAHVRRQRMAGCESLPPGRDLVNLAEWPRSPKLTCWNGWIDISQFIYYF
jgi:hypothetical protein